MYFLLLHKCLLFILLLTIPNPSRSEIGTSGQYNPPFLPTACYGYDSGQFPSNNLFAAAGDGIWDNGAACGRIYLVKCISGTEPGTCVVGHEVIQVKIVDYAITSVSRPSIEGSTMVLSATAFRSIANSTADSISIEFKELRLINKKWLLSIFQKANWTCKPILKAEYESWTPKIKDTKVELGTDAWSVCFKAEVGVFILIVKAKFPPLWRYN